MIWGKYCEALPDGTMPSKHLCHVLVPPESPAPLPPLHRAAAYPGSVSETEGGVLAELPVPWLLGERQPGGASGAWSRGSARPGGWGLGAGGQGRGVHGLMRIPDLPCVCLPLTAFFFFSLLRGTPAAHGSSQARGRMGAAAAGLHHSHSNTGSQPLLRPTPQLTASPDP